MEILILFGDALPVCDIYPINQISRFVVLYRVRTPQIQLWVQLWNQ